MNQQGEGAVVGNFDKLFMWRDEEVKFMNTEAKHNEILETNVGGGVFFINITKQINTVILAAV